jgi:hypothetical protein
LTFQLSSFYKYKLCGLNCAKRCSQLAYGCGNTTERPLGRCCLRLHLPQLADSTAAVNIDSN